MRPLRAIPLLLTLLMCGNVSCDAAEPYLKDTTNNTNLTPGEKGRLQQGEMAFEYVLPKDSRSISNGALLILVERFFPETYPTERPVIQLHRGEGIGGGSKAISKQLYQNYNSRPITNATLRTWFHRNYARAMRTDEPIQTLGPNYQFSDYTKVCNRSAFLIIYSKTKGYESSIPFLIGTDTDNTKALIKVIDLKDGTTEPSSYKWYLEK